MHPAAPSDPIDFLVIGHVSLDRTPNGPRLGGTAAYAALTARALGLRPAIVTSAGRGADLSGLLDIPMVTVPSPASTAFENLYLDEGRVQLLLGRASGLTVEAIPEAWASAGIVHLGPIADEMEPGLIEHITSAQVLGVSAQGWLRAWDADGRVRPRSWEWLAGPLQKADAVVVSYEDLGRDEIAIEGLTNHCRLLVVTDGPRGARVHWNGDVRRVPAPQAASVDPTGAGDIFAAAFFARLRATRDPWEAARFAQVLASASVGRRGLDGIPTPADVSQAELQVVP
ncbi:MAG TPA: PfkB family carbohydrate kinase [Anaerolineales bacterium]|nr:PfkB family carbohydrate kinase [Anaerolineales bacterium]